MKTLNKKLNLGDLLN